MRIFVTGAAGFIGFAAASSLARAGHEVSGLTRKAETAGRLAAAEIAPVIGDMADAASWMPAARACDAVIHCAAEYSERNMTLDRQAVQH